MCHFQIGKNAINKQLRGKLAGRKQMEDEFEVYKGVVTTPATRIGRSYQ